MTFREASVVQKFLPAVRHGDKRIILIDGKAGGAVNRVPAADDLRANWCAAARRAATDLSERERGICEGSGRSSAGCGLLWSAST